MVMSMAAEAVRMIVAVPIAMGVAVGLAVLVGMGMHLRVYCTRLPNAMQRWGGA
jgi:hypothetical protein